MQMKIKIKRLDSAINAYIQKLRIAREYALIDVADYTKSQALPKTPLLYGQLRQSAMIENSPSGAFTILKYTANYAWAVHENINPNVAWTEAGTGPRFLLNILQNKKPEILQKFVRRMQNMVKK